MATFSAAHLSLAQILDFIRPESAFDPETVAVLRPKARRRPISIWLDRVRRAFVNRSFRHSPRARRRRRIRPELWTGAAAADFYLA
jgi:hypothetical protein